VCEVRHVDGFVLFDTVNTLALSGYRMQPADSSVIRSYDVFGRDTIRVLNMPEEKERIYRFIAAFEERYGRKPKLEDAEGDFKLQVARDMQMSVGGAWTECVHTPGS
jgi:hypothetical protein